MCFPEAYLPGLRGQDFEVLPFDQAQQERALQAVAQWARTYAVATILGMERLTEAGRQIVACVIDARGQIQGYQTKNQLDPTEDQFYVPGNTRRLFEINGVKFGVAICHEGWRYPETVRWAAVRGAKIVFHPQHTGSDREGVRLTQWGAAGGPYYEKAMMMRSLENTIYFASVNYALRFQESATSLIDPVGPVPGVLALWAGRRAGAGHQRRGGDRPARRAIRTRALSRDGRLTSQSESVAIGLKCHSGWAALVALGFSSSSSSKSLAVIDRRRIELVEPGDEGWAKQPYHAAGELESAEAAALVRRGIESARRIAAREMKRLEARLRKDGHRVMGCAVLVGKPLPDWTTQEILAVHVRMHQAEGALFPDALARAVEACGLPLVTIAQAELEAQAEKTCGRSASLLRKDVAALGKSVGAPWGADQKAAALAAMVVLGQR